MATIPLSTRHRRSAFLSRFDKLTAFDITSIFQPQPTNHRPRQVYINTPLPLTAWKSDKHNNLIIGKPLNDWIYPSNQIRTAKYSLLTFLPRNLLEQFRRIANVFFLILVILQFIPKFSQVSPFLACLPLLAVLAITAIKDVYEDVRRHQADHNTNSQSSHVLRSTFASIIANQPHYLNPNFTRPPQHNPLKLNWFKHNLSGSEDATTLATETGQVSSTQLAKKHWWNRRLKLKKKSTNLIHSTTIHHTPIPPTHSSLPPISKTISSSDPQATLPQSNFKKTQWQDIRVGDFVKLYNDESVPADMIICSTSDEEENVCFIETKNLDGETNLKSRHAVKELVHLRTVDDCLDKDNPKNAFMIDSEAPNPNLFKYNAAIVFSKITQQAKTFKDNVGGSAAPHDESEATGEKFEVDNVRVPVDLNTILLRGTVIRNTEWVIGLVVFTGPDTKIMLNSSGTPSKRSKVERLMNPMVFVNLALLFVMCLFNGIGTHLSEKYYYQRNSYWTVGSNLSDDNPSINGAVGFANAMITYQNIVPISLYISIEFVRTLQAWFIYADDHLYYKPTKRRTLARSWNLSDDLGQIQYVFSDKTGTLTQNLMLFRKCSIGGVVYRGQVVSMESIDEEEEEDATVHGGTTPFPKPGVNRAPESGSHFNNPLHKPVVNRQPPRSSVSSTSADAPSSKSKNKQQSEDSVFNSADEAFLQTEIHGLEPFHDSLIARHLADTDSSQAKLIYGFFATLALCHTVLASEDQSGVISYKAQSPDESALVQAAADVGFVFRGREKNLLRMQVPSEPIRRTSQANSAPMKRVVDEDMGIELVDGLTQDEAETEVHEYELLELNEFTSARKRMSVVVRRLDAGRCGPGCVRDGQRDDSLYLLVKGADNVIFDRLAPGQDVLKQTTNDQLEEFAASGLRTLCLAYRKLEEDEFEAWSVKYSRATSEIGPDREKAIEAVQDELEHSLFLLGATAIEDKLQDGVPEAIADLKRAGIKVWVATGDKLETAVAIARSCNLIAKDMNLIIIRGGAFGTNGSTYSQLRKAMVDFFDGAELVENLKEMPPGHVPLDRRPSTFSEAIDLHEIVGEDNGHRSGGYGLVIDGASLHHGFAEAYTKELLLELSTRCQAVICCRTSPKQKAEIVNLVKDGTHSMTLAIGDGANDVSMIQSADIGVGVSGEEGLQAVNASDYAIGQFRYLTRLLFVHGHWSYDRNAKMIVNFFYKEIIGISVLWFFQFWCAYSTTTMYEYTYLLFYNVFWTLLPVIGIGVFDQNIRQQVLVNVPELYSTGRDGNIFGLKIFGWYMLEGIYQGAVCFFFITFAYNTTTARSDGFDVAMDEFSTVVIVAVVLACNLFNGLDLSSWNWWTFTFVLIGPVLIILYTVVYSAIKPGWIWTTIYGNNHFLWSSPYWWFGLLLAIALSLIPHYLIKYYRDMYCPTDLQILRYVDRNDPEHDYKNDMQMPYIRELARYKPNVEQHSLKSPQPDRPVFERTSTNLSVTHDMFTGHRSPGSHRGYAFDQADGTGELALGNRVRRYNTSRLTIPEEVSQQEQQDQQTKSDRRRSIKIGKLEIGKGSLSLREKQQRPGSGQGKNSGGTHHHGHGGFAKKISDMFHHHNHPHHLDTNPHPNSNLPMVTAGASEGGGGGGGGLEVVLHEPPVEEGQQVDESMTEPMRIEELTEEEALDETGGRRQHCHGRRQQQETCGEMTTILNLPPSFASWDSVALFDHHHNNRLSRSSPNEQQAATVTATVSVAEDDDDDNSSPYDDDDRQTERRRRT